MQESEIRTDIRKLEKEDIEQWLLANSEAKYRTNQILEWLWQKAVTNFSEMSNLSLSLRQKLDQHFSIQTIQVDKIQVSNDGTMKFRFKLHEGYFIESVLIPVPTDKRYTVCVSTQVGCSLSCKFCATGKLERKRNLEAAEIYDQVVLVNKYAISEFGQALTNIVYMGMGEPLLNFHNTLKSIELISSEIGLHMSPRRITVSTAGISKMIKKLGDLKVRFNLALSLHAADDTKRDEIMPINEHNRLESLMEALTYFYEKTKNKISFEYISFKDFNDSLEDAKRLEKLCRNFPVRINIIEYNPIEGSSFIKTSEDKLDQFASYLRGKGVMVTIRRSRGKDIDAACGQLANKD